MTPVLIAVVIGTGLLALVPTRRIAQRSPDQLLVLGYYLALWILLAAAILVPGFRRIAIPLVLVVAIAPWVTLREGIDRLLGRPPRERRPPPRNVTPPEARETSPR